jgi:starch synthase
VSQIEVLAVASEIYPLVKTGGLADVVGALPKALQPLGVRIRTLVPGYPAVMAGLEGARTARRLPDVYGGPARLVAATTQGLELFVLDAPHLYDRPGGPYADAGGREFTDNAHRFAALGRAAASLGQGIVPRYRPQVVHTHDWQAGLAAAFLVYDGGTRPGIVQHRLPEGRRTPGRPDHHRLADLRRRDLHARARHGHGRPAARPRRPAERRAQRHRHRDLEP